MTATFTGSSSRLAKRPHGEGSLSDAASTADTAETADEDAASRVKLPRLERAGDDFSSVVKSKLQSYTRTGQACDRCKVRKIRCDALPEGCSHCISQKLECYVTDRISGRTERRGYLQELEREKLAMQAHIQQLQSLLREQGVEVLPWRWSAYVPVYPPDVTVDDKGSVVQDATNPWSCLGSVWYKDKKSSSDGESSTCSALTKTTTATTATATATATASDHYLSEYASASALQSVPKDSYLGVYADRSPLNSVNGTQVSILGTLLDIDLSPSAAEPEPSTIYREPTGLYNRSVGSFFRSFMNINPPLQDVELPSRSDAFEYSEWYFLIVQPFIPVLHKPSYMALLARIYDDPKYQATTSELVLVHMVFATIYFQYGARNREEPSRQMQLHDLSNKHYHWALNKMYNLMCDWSLTAVQAVLLITAYTRAFPKPGCGSTMAQFCLMKAVDLGLHRVPASTPSTTTLDIEMRRRCWWTSLMLCITLNGRLGRPMPISLREFDTDLPVAVPDEYLTAEGITDLSKVGSCVYLFSLHAFRCTPLFMEMFSTIYGARRDPRRYEATIRDLDRQFWAIEADLPTELRTDRCKPTEMVGALYAEAIMLEFRLCLWHPSVCLSTDRQMRAHNTRICEDAARRLLKVVQRLLAFKSLDTTWYQMSVYCAAMFSTVAGVWERRFTATREEVEVLQDETSIWLSVIAEIGLLTGASNDSRPFNSKLTHICARTISWILRDMPDGNRVVDGGGNGSGSGGGSGGGGGSGSGMNGGGSNSNTNPSNGHIDSVAIKLEAEARRKLEDRIDNKESMSNMYGHGSSSTTANSSSTTTTTTVTTTTTNNAYVPVSMSYTPMALDDNSGHRQQQQPQHLPHHQHQHLQQPQQPQHQAPPPYMYTTTPDGSFMTEAHAAAASAAAAAAAAASTGAAGHAATTGSLAAGTTANNTWTDWTAAIAASNSQDRFASADALLDLSVLHQRLAPMPPPSSMSVDGSEAGRQQAAAAQAAATAQAAQAVPGPTEWPLLLYNENSGL